MNAIRGKYVDGTVVLDTPADWPNGTEVVVEPLNGEAVGLREDEWPTTPEGIAALLARMDQLEAIEMTPGEEADVTAWRQKIKQYTIAHMNDGIDELFP
jgi:ABC-type phosphate/phosphonate transport system substrate-binding protein